MKSFKTWWMCCVVAAASLSVFTACEEKNNGGGGTGDGTKDVLSPDSQKAKLQQVATELANTFKTEDQKDIVQLADYFAYKYGEYSWEKVGEHYEDDYAIFRTAARSIKQLAAGDMMSNPAEEVFSFPKATGIFEANDATHEWEWKANSNEGEVVLRFKNKDGEWCEAKAVGKGQEFEYSGTYETNEVVDKTWVDVPGYGESQLRLVEEYVSELGEYVDVYDEDGNYAYGQWFEQGETVPAHYEWQWVETNGYWDYEYARQPFKAVLPSDITVTLNELGTEHVNIHMTFDVERTDHVNFATAMRVANIKVNVGTELSKTKCMATADIKYGDKTLFTFGAQMPSCVLVDKTEGVDWEEWLDHYDSLWGEDVRAEYGPVFASADIMGQVQVKASSNNLDQLFKEIRKLEESSNNDKENWWENDDYTLDYNQCYAGILSQNFGCQLYYGSNVEQARMEWRADAYETEVWEDGSEEPVNKLLYDIIPVICFPQDGTTYAFDKYFTEQAFGSVIDMTEKLLNNYIKLFEYNDIEPIEF